MITENFNGRASICISQIELRRPADAEFIYDYGKNHMNYTKILVMLYLIGSVSACSARQPSYEKIAQHYVYQKAREDSDPNFRTHINNSVQMVVPFFKQFYDTGVSDKAGNITQQQYEQRISYFKSDEFISSIEATTQFISPKVHKEKVNESQNSKRLQQVLTDNVISAYKAGYDGK